MENCQHGKSYEVDLEERLLKDVYYYVTDFVFVEVYFLFWF